jgi:DNA helicase-2/ATP-dependent DNA helicase PcrA
VLDAARAVIDKNRQRTPKALFTDRQGGAPVTVYEAYNETDEADYIIDRIAEQRRRGLAYGDFAVMYRTNAQSRALEEAFIKARMPYKLVGGVGFYKRREVRDLLAYLRLINNPNDTVSFNRIINVPKRGIGDKSLQTFQSWMLRQRYTLAAALDAIRQGELPPLSAAAAKRFVEFAALVDGWRTLAQAGDLSALLDDILLKIGYNLHLLETSDTPEQGREREENVRELRALLDRSKDKPLSAFLDEIALVSDVDALQASDDAVTLLTLHSAKGLEYPVVFITGLEEGLLPHFRSFEEPDEMAEERRLMYVGLTRAMHAVYLSYAFRRMTYGESGPSAPSRFLYDIPGDLTSGMPAGLASDRSMRRLLADAVWDDMPSAAADGMRPVSSGAARPYPGASAAGAGLRFKTGLRVYHARFGEGIVIESRRSGQDEEVTISFREPGVGIKTLAASFANLIVLDQ